MDEGGTRLYHGEHKGASKVSNVNQPLVSLFSLYLPRHLSSSISIVRDLCNTTGRSFMRGFCQRDNITNFTARPPRPQSGVYVSDLCGLCDLVVKFSLSPLCPRVRFRLSGRVTSDCAP